MGGDAWLTLVLLVAMLLALALDRFPPAPIVLGTSVGLMLFDVISFGEAFSGFSNSAPITVAALYILAAAVQKSGLLVPLVHRVLGSRTGRSGLARLLVPTASASAFLNNTPLVAMLMPNLLAWCRARSVSPSRYLMPLSFATILGGITTLIGTSTNLVVSGLLEERTGDALGFFEVTKIGLPTALVALVVLLLVSRLVPERLSASQQAEEQEREFVVEMEVIPGGLIDGATVSDAGLRDLRGLFLVEIERAGATISPVAPDRRVDGGDVLTFVGHVDDIVDLQQNRGLRSTESRHLMAVDSPRHTFFEVVIGQSSPLVGRTVREAEFRGTYQAAVVAIHRSGRRIDAKLGDVTLRNGDTLLLLAGPDFRETWQNRRDFLLVARLGGNPPSSSAKAPIVAVVVLATVLASALGILPIVEAALLGAGVLIATRCLTYSEALAALDLDVLVVIGAAFGLGAAMQSSGLALEIADGLTSAFDPLGTAGVVFGIVLASALLTELVTNNAAAVVMFPIAFEAANRTDLDPRLLVIGSALAASASFLTPIGYQTNTMVYGPGGYRFTDYARLGLPISLIVLVGITTGVVNLS